MGKKKLDEQKICFVGEKMDGFKKIKKDRQQENVGRKRGEKELIWNE